MSRLVRMLRSLGFGRLLSWRHLEKFEPAWGERIRFMAQRIDASHKSVVDLGCGPQWLKGELRPGVRYVGVDYRDRGPGTVVCDFNAGEFPSGEFDVAFVSGCMEYVEDWRWFVQMVCVAGRRVILSYCALEAVPSISRRREHAWRSDASRGQIEDEFARRGYRLRSRDQYDEMNTVFVFER